MIRRSTSAASAILLLIASLWGLASCASKKSSPAPSGGTTTRELDSGDIATSGGTYAHRFFNAGAFPYRCIYHSPMTGTVTVNAGATDTIVTVSIISSSSPFPAAAIKPGGRVTWVNNTGMVHTVTSN